MSNRVPFADLTEDEANAIVAEIKTKAKSDDELRTLLDEAGFDGRAAAISSISCGSMYWPLVMVWGPNGEIITG